MKAEHRHELKTNELADWIAHFPKWAKENTRMIIYISVIVIAVAGAYIHKHYRKQELARNKIKFTKLVIQLPQQKRAILSGHRQGEDKAIMLLGAASTLQAAAQDLKNEQMSALALIKQAETLRTELHYSLEVMDDLEYIQGQLKLALNSYKEAIGYCSSNPALTAKIKFGMALCVEELGEFDKAKQMYQDIVADTSLEATIGAAQAKLRLALMENYKEKVAFLVSQEPAPPAQPLIQPPVQPQIQPQTQPQPETPQAISPTN